MSKDIWHAKDEIPRQESRVVWKSGNVVCGGRFDTSYKCFCGPASQFVDLKKVIRWTYIDDLLAVETELERTRKALDVAVDALREIHMPKQWCPVFAEQTIAKQALDKIVALEQKDKL